MAEKQTIERVVNPLVGQGEQARQPSNALVEIERERAITEVQAMIVAAHKFPRIHKLCLDQIINECCIPELAEEATYDYNRGGEEISGPSIRLAEVVARGWGNIEYGVRELSRHDGQDGKPGYSSCQSYAWDLETMVRDVRSFQVRHWRDTKRGGYAVTDERDIYEIAANIGARRKRAAIESVIPKYVWQAALKQCALTLKATTEVTPKLIATMLESFEPLGVTQEMIEKRIQRRIQEMLPQQAMKMRRIYNSITGEMSKVEDWFDVPLAGEATEEKTASGRAKPQRKKKGEPKADAPKDDAKKEDVKGADTTKENEPLTGPEVAQLVTRLEAAQITAEDFCKAFKIDAIIRLRRALLAEALKWIADPGIAPKLA